MRELTITIPLDAQTATAYNSASPQEKKKMEALALAAGQYPSLQKALDEIGRKAEARDLRPRFWNLC